MMRKNFNDWMQGQTNPFIKENPVEERNTANETETDWIDVFQQARYQNLGYKLGAITALAWRGLLLVMAAAAIVIVIDIILYIVSGGAI